ncbi:MAG: M28 family peptidase [Proteobacteria bacterium]|nr:MAG: M28 family peptidase [Pseudomonadota bacterium]
MKLSVAALSSIAFLSMANTCRSSSSELVKLPWDEARVSRDLKVLSAEPHPLGSARIAFLADYLEKEMKDQGLESGRDKFTAEVPDPELLGQDASPMRKATLSIPMQNIFAKFESGKSDCAFLVASHYDSKRLTNGDGIGANDSGSSSVALLELMRGLNAAKKGKSLDLRCTVIAVWFDGEEAYLPEWRDGQTRHPARIVDNTYGSRQLADSLKACGGGYCLPDVYGGQKIEGLILLDMVGSPDLRLTRESSSSKAYAKIAQDLDKKLFQGQLFTRSTEKAVEDDHIPFVEKGIPAIDLIGFETLDHWHQPSDTIENVSLRSIEQATELTGAMLQKILTKE